MALSRDDIKFLTLLRESGYFSVVDMSFLHHIEIPIQELLYLKMESGKWTHTEGDYRYEVVCDVEDYSSNGYYHTVHDARIYIYKKNWQMATLHVEWEDTPTHGADIKYGELLPSGNLCMVTFGKKDKEPLKLKTEETPDNIVWRQLDSAKTRGESIIPPSSVSSSSMEELYASTLIKQEHVHDNLTINGDLLKEYTCNSRKLVYNTDELLNRGEKTMTNLRTVTITFIDNDVNLKTNKKVVYQEKDILTELTDDQVKLDVIASGKVKTALDKHNLDVRGQTQDKGLLRTNGVDVNLEPIEQVSQLAVSIVQTA